MGGGGSSSKNYTTSSVNVDTTTIVNSYLDTDNLAVALEKNAQAILSANDANLVLQKAQTQATLDQNAAIEQAKLNQNASIEQAKLNQSALIEKAKMNLSLSFLQNFEDGTKKMLMLGGLGFAAYKIINQKPKKGKK